MSFNAFVRLPTTLSPPIPLTPHPTSLHHTSHFPASPSLPHITLPRITLPHITLPRITLPTSNRPRWPTQQTATPPEHHPFCICICLCMWPPHIPLPSSHSLILRPFTFPIHHPRGQPFKFHHFPIRPFPIHPLPLPHSPVPRSSFPVPRSSFPQASAARLHHTRISFSIHPFHPHITCIRYVQHPYIIRYVADCAVLCCDVL